MIVAIIIPARFKSTRFPGKPLAKILGKTLVERVWLNCIQALPKKNVYVATDSKKIISHCKSKNMQVIKTSESCLTGTDRVYEASKKIKADIIINVQGDEPLVSHKDLKKVINQAKKNPDIILNAMCRITHKKDFKSNSVPKVVFQKNNYLMYISRAPIPSGKKDNFIKSWKQVCIYAFSKKHLKIFANFKKKTPNELYEDIEILRFLELGMKVKMIEVSKSSIAVDYQKDISKVEKILLNKKIK